MVSVSPNKQYVINVDHEIDLRKDTSRKNSNADIDFGEKYVSHAEIKNLNVSLKRDLKHYSGRNSDKDYSPRFGQLKEQNSQLRGNLSPS